MLTWRGLAVAAAAGPNLMIISRQAADGMAMMDGKQTRFDGNCAAVRGTLFDTL